MQAVILLKGRANCGKTYTLDLLIQLLLRKPNIKILYLSKPGARENFWEKYHDGFIIVEINEKKIGIITKGDPGAEEETRNYREICSNYNCDILVAACRTKCIPGSIYDETIKYCRNRKGILIEMSTIKIIENNKNYLLKDQSDLSLICAQSILSILL